MEHLLNWNNLQEDYERLGTQHAIAAEYGCAQQTVAKAMKRLGITAKPMQAHAKYIWNDKDALQEAYSRLGSIRAVAEGYGCGVQTINRAVKRLGLQMPVTTTGRKFVWTDERKANHKTATNTPEFKEAHRVSLINRFATLRSRATDSPLEALLHAALNRAGVSFTTQKAKLGKYVVDIELLQMPVIIEADGFNHRLERQQAKDEVRDVDLTKAGYQVFRFTGTEINADADDCIRSVMDKTGVMADKNPIADIRRAGRGPDSLSWRGGKTEFTCRNCGQQFMEYATSRQSKNTFCNMECYIAHRREHSR